MKEQILKVIETSLKKDYFLNCKINLTVNYKNVYGHDYNNPIYLKNCNINEIINILNDFDKIKGYNITLEEERNINHNYTYEKDKYPYNWVSNSFVFWSGVDEDSDDKKIDRSKYGKFEWVSYGDRESLNGNGISKKLSRPDYNSDKRYAMIDGNYFEYDKVGDKMDLIHELDLLLDKQHEEKMNIYKKLKLEL